MGRFLKAVAESAPSCYGVDVSEAMVRRAREYLPQSVEVHTLDSEPRIPFDDGFFDCVYSYAVMQHIKLRSNVVKAIAEICRVLKPGGQAKIQFEMLYPFISKRKFGPGSSHAFEKVTVIWGWSRRFRIPLWRARVLRHNHWGGARLGYQEIIREFLQ